MLSPWTLVRSRVIPFVPDVVPSEISPPKFFQFKKHSCYTALLKCKILCYFWKLGTYYSYPSYLNNIKTPHLILLTYQLLKQQQKEINTMKWTFRSDKIFNKGILRLQKHLQSKENKHSRWYLDSDLYLSKDTNKLSFSEGQFFCRCCIIIIQSSCPHTVCCSSQR